MNKLRSVFLSAAVAAAAFGALSCSLEPPASGRLVLQLPSSGAARGVLVLGAAPAIRIYIVLNGNFIKAQDGKDYYYKTLAASSSASDSNTFSIDLPAYSGYRVYAAIGNTASGTWTDTAYYGQTDSFKVAPGSNTSVELAVEKSLIAQAASASGACAAIVDGKLCIFTSGAVSYDGASVSTANLPAGTTVSAIVEGKWFGASAGTFALEPWLCTSSGIWAVSGGALVQRSTSFGSNARFAGAMNTKWTETLPDSTTLEHNGLFVYYYIAGTKMGMAFADTAYAASSAPMIDGFGTVKDLPALLDPGYDWASDPDLKDLKDLKDQIQKIAGDILVAVAVGIDAADPAKSYAYFATALGSFYYNESMQEVLKGDAGQWIKDNIANNPFSIAAYSEAGDYLPITSFALAGATATAQVLYAGTEKGLFYTPIVADANNNYGKPGYLVAGNTIGGKPSLYSVAGGSAIKLLAATAFGGGTYVATVDAEGNLIVRNYAGGSFTVVKEIPFYAITDLAGNIQNLTFSGSGSALYLQVGSSDGMSTITIVQPAT